MTQSNPDPNVVTPAAAAAAAAAVAAVAATPHKPPDDIEETYYEGSPLLRGAIGKGILWVVIAIVLVAGSLSLAIFTTWRIPWWVHVVAFVIAVILVMIPVIQTKAIRYRITNYRIDYERGLLSKKIDTLELWHVEDLSFYQSLFDRILGVGDIRILSHDETMPVLNMRSIPHPRPLFEQLKQRVIAVKRSRGVIKMDPG